MTARATLPWTKSEIARLTRMIAEAEASGAKPDWARMGVILSRSADAVRCKWRDINAPPEGVASAGLPVAMTQISASRQDWTGERGDPLDARTMDPVACRHLWSAVLLYAWRDSFKSSPGADSEAEEMRRQAVIWFASPDFTEVCWLVGLDPAEVRPIWREMQARFDACGRPRHWLTGGRVPTVRTGSLGARAA